MIKIQINKFNKQIQKLKYQNKMSFMNILLNYFWIKIITNDKLKIIDIDIKIDTL